MYDPCVLSIYISQIIYIQALWMLHKALLHRTKINVSIKVGLSGIQWQVRSKTIIDNLGEQT